MENKMTHNEMYDLIAELCADNAEVVEFCAAQKEKLAAKAAKAKIRAAEKKAAGNEFYHSVVAVIGAEPMTRDAVLEVYGDNDGEITLGKIQAALNWGVKQNYLVKETAKIDGKTKTLYTAAN